MARKKKVKLLETLIESLKKKWESASIRDIVYITSYVAAVGLSYKVLMTAKGFPAITLFDIIGYVTKQLKGEEPEPEGIDLDILLTSCVVAYIVLKIDMDDITAAATKITTVAASFA